MVHVDPVLVSMRRALVPMRVAMFAVDRRIVLVVVVIVVMAMGVFVLERVVRVQVPVPLREVQVDRRREEKSGNDRIRPYRSIPHAPSSGCTNERGDGKDRTCTRGSDGPLRTLK